MQHDTPVRHLELTPTGVRVITDTGEHHARRVVVAVGAWSAGLVGRVLQTPAVPDPLPLVVTQEQPAHFALRAHAPGEETWPSFTHDPGPVLAGPARRWPSGVYGLATPGEGIKVGFHGVGPVTDPDHRTFRAEPDQLAQLQDYVTEWVPGVDPTALAPISCTYTTTPDHDFVLDRAGRLVVAAGFSGHGFKFAPAIGRVLADLAGEQSAAPSGAASRFHIARFARVSRSPLTSGVQS